jgi:hypothetical protein
MIIDIINCFVLEFLGGEHIVYAILKNITTTLLLCYMDITGILFIYYGGKLYLMLYRLSKVVHSSTITNHMRKVAIVTFIGGFILIIKSGVMLYHVIKLFIDRRETPIEDMLWIVVPYHVITEILPLTFFQIFLWRNNSEETEEKEEDVEVNSRNSRNSNRKSNIKDRNQEEEEEEDVLMPIYKKAIIEI